MNSKLEEMKAVSKRNLQEASDAPTMIILATGFTSCVGCAPAYAGRSHAAAHPNVPAAGRRCAPSS